MFFHDQLSHSYQADEEVGKRRQDKGPPEAYSLELGAPYYE